MWSYLLLNSKKNLATAGWNFLHPLLTVFTGWSRGNGMSKNSCHGGGNTGRRSISTRAAGPQKSTTATITHTDSGKHSGTATHSDQRKVVVRWLSGLPSFVCATLRWALSQVAFTHATFFAWTKRVGSSLSLKTVSKSACLLILILLFALNSNGCTATISELPPPMEDY